MFEILTVCTGNICRSPLAETLLRTRLAPYSPRVHSAGTMGLDAAPMTPEAVKLALALGVPQDVAEAHRSRYLTDAELRSPDLILAMSREHRRKIVELAPARLRSAFTVREFARLAADTSDEEIAAASITGGADGSARARAAVAAVAAQRGMSAPPADLADDDVIDPYRRSWETYQRSASQLVPAVDQVVRVMSIAMTAR
ncbi:low molecular weight phosphatase family protein [Microbacterium sp. PRC9]|uniref:arsenate reductase/protein-tyrosine-phosphatase family protein n=1 Tax=Microbacterium sp. PRC9 TaxID=2962591 RepID=UPI002881BE49|nr:low molecular weight phosphatase family protein [Microbacterium sp. PRC9]MDT0141484.1 low molecular weight phosphatase family protein [Microbacterium sp. PRC9]